MTFSSGDGMRFKPGVTAAFGPPDRRGKGGTATAAWSGGGLERLDVLFDDETTVKKGYAAVQFEPVV